ncbi:hypothetical protein NG99_07025 [Erwinia typographi]|uniref:Type IV / VI secretion system DotU domain-containing protein n=2 Tax=Erwinia typographi TaxID=371042 RepID=A0A0A3ZAF0_9GAMM|nr:hypothetical protein NG99_07025 [Erwinia typographi]
MDVIFQDTWLLALAIRNTPGVVVDKQLYQYCLKQIEAVQEKLQQAGATEAVCEEIKFAHCVFLDEAVMTQKDVDVSFWWHESPLQSRLLMHLRGGEYFYEHIKKLLREPAPSVAITACYHRMLLLGYKGKCRTEDNGERLSLMRQLETLLPDVPGNERHQDIVVSTGPREGQWWHSPPVVLMALVLFTAGMWAGLRMFLLAQ